MFRMCMPVCLGPINLTRRPIDALIFKDERTLASDVLVPFKNGLLSFNHLSEVLLSMNTDTILPTSPTFDSIRQEILTMNMHLKKSEEKASEELQSLDKSSEQLTVEQGNLESQKKQMEGKLVGFNIQMEGHRANFINYSAAMDTERRNLQSAQDTLNHMRHKRDEAERLRNIGIGLMFVPFGGWIAGSVMIGIGQQDLDSASRQVDRARTEVDRCESQVRFYSQQVSLYEGLISQTRTDIHMADIGIQEIGAKLTALSIKRESVANFQSKTRNAVHHLGLVCGVGNVAEVETRRLILLETMMNVMEEMMSDVREMGDLVPAEDMQVIMLEMKSNQSKLEAAKQQNMLDNKYF